jgi:hypothetical protein
MVGGFYIYRAIWRGFVTFSFGKFVKLAKSSGRVIKRPLRRGCVQESGRRGVQIMVVGFYRYSPRRRGFVTVFLKKICKILENRRKSSG